LKVQAGIVDERADDAHLVHAKEHLGAFFVRGASERAFIESDWFVEARVTMRELLVPVR